MSGELAFARTPLKVIGWTLFGLLCLLCFGVTWAWVSFSTEETCGPTPPTAWRLEVTLGGLAFWTVLAGITLYLLIRGRALGMVIALGLELVAGIVSIVTFLLPLFAAGMC